MRRIGAVQMKSVQQMDLLSETEPARNQLSDVARARARTELRQMLVEAVATATKTDESEGDDHDG